jgi:hypothetical protein
MKQIDWLEVVGKGIGSILGLCIIGMYVIAPLALIKALNVFFQLGVPYNAETYCLSAILILMFGNPNFSFSDRRE